MPLLATALAWSAALGLSGCASSPSPRYYSLAESTPPAAVSATEPLFIELAPLALPERLMRPQLVVRRANTASPELNVLEQYRWASSFENELRDAVSMGMAARLGAIDVSRNGQPSRGAHRIRISLQVQQFDAQEGQGIDAAFTWSLRHGEEGPVRACHLTLSEPTPGDIEALAMGAQRISSRLTKAMATSVQGLLAGQNAPC